jgi:DHA1 family bicyclomycin/chloramphenicol resistance-like MFS transporter
MKWNQKLFLKWGMILLLALMSSFSALTTDIYLPALPLLKDTLATSQSMINLTLSMYFIFFAGGMLFWGPLSEKYGRKPILFIGLVLYTLASIGCGLSENIAQLIGCRILQGFAGSSPVVCATAIVKDIYSGREREQVMALVFSVVFIAPIVAPVLGALLLTYLSWQAIFFLLAAVGTVTLVGICFLRETLAEKSNVSVVGSWGRLLVVVLNPNFTMLLVLFSFGQMCILSFLTASSFIYILGFGMSEQQYSYFLVFNAVCSMVGPVLYVKLADYLKPKHIILGCFLLFSACGFLIITIGHLSAYIFAFLVATATFSVLLMRVPSTNLMLEQQDGDTGSATGLIAFFGMLMGSLGMYLVTLYPENLIVALGTLQLVTGLIGTLCWIIIRNRSAFQYDFHKASNNSPKVTELK